MFISEDGSKALIKQGNKESQFTNLIGGGIGEYE